MSRIVLTLISRVAVLYGLLTRQGVNNNNNDRASRLESSVKNIGPKETLRKMNTLNRDTNNTVYLIKRPY